MINKGEVQRTDILNLENTQNLDISVTGIVSRIYSRNRNGVIFSMDDLASESSKKYRIKTDFGVLPIQPTIGEIWAVSGKPVFTEEYGVQICAVDCHRQRPNGSVLVDFLYRNNRFPGLGKTKAKRLWNLFGENLYSILDNEDYDALTDKDRGNVGIKVANTIFSQWKEYAEEMPIIRWLQQKKFPAQLARSIYEVYKKDAITKIEADPYRMLSFSNWIKVDEIAFKMGGITRRF